MIPNICAICGSFPGVAEEAHAARAWLFAKDTYEHYIKTAEPGTVEAFKRFHANMVAAERRYRKLVEVKP